MSTIVQSNSTTQLLSRAVGTDIYTSLKLPGTMVTLPGFFEDKTVADTMPKLVLYSCGVILADSYGVCTWTISNDEVNDIVLTNSAMVMQLRNSSGCTAIPASELITYGSDINTTYALNIYIKTANTQLNAGEYTALIKL